MQSNLPFGGQEGRESSRDEKELTPEEQQLLTRIAQKVVEKQMTVPAIMVLESVKPLNWFGSQAMVFFEPFIGAIVGDKSFGFVNMKDYNLFRQMMERRENTERLLQKIEELDAIQLEKERVAKRKRKADKKAQGGGLIKRFIRWVTGREEASTPPNKIE